MGAYTCKRTGERLGFKQFYGIVSGRLLASPLFETHDSLVPDQS